MVTLKKVFRLFISCYFVCMFFTSCQKTPDNESIPPDPSEFINYSIDGVNHTYEAPGDVIGTINSDSSESGTFGSYFNPTIRIHSTGHLDGNYSVLSFSLGGIAVNSNQQLNMFGTTTIFGAYNPLLAQTPLFVHITEYGQVGEFIAGNFQGILFETQAPNQNQAHNIICSFRVKRTF